MSLLQPHRIGKPSEAVIDLDRLIVMANQIADFFAPYPPSRRQEGIRNHLRTYWDPRLRKALLDHIEKGGEGLNAYVVAGANLLKQTEMEKKGYYGPPKA